MAEETKRLGLPLIGLVLVSGALLSARLVAASAVGFGDSEALYAAYALHPAPAYLDHPGLIGLVARTIGSGTAPSPHSAHQVTAVLATLLPWLMVLAARAAGAEKNAAYVAALVVAVCPEISIGLFAMTPDLLLAILWLGTLGLASFALARPPSDASAACFVGAGLLAGIACSAKVPGGLLFVALVCAYFSRAAKAHTRTIWPWAGLLLGAIVLFPIVWFEARTGFPMLQHRLVDTQAGSGPSLRNVGAVLAGQLLYLSPVIVILAAWAAVDLVRTRHEDAIASLLYYAFVIPFVPLVLLSLWSRVAEPHWIAPALLVLPIHAARRPITRISRSMLIAAVAVGVAITAFVHAWVLVPSVARLAPASVDPKLDISSELYGWPEALAAVEQLSADEPDAVIVGPHWVICAQLEAALGTNHRVGCMTPVRDDFDVWRPRGSWQSADRIIFVTDKRFETDLSKTFPDRTIAQRERITVLRGGRISRTFTIAVLESRGRANL
jgi:hypothetical protein